LSKSKQPEKKKSAPARKVGPFDFNPEKSKYYLPIFFLILLIGIIVLFSDFIFSDKMLKGSDTLNAGIFFRHFYVEYFKAFGSVPVWNPYIFAGIPFVDAFHGDTYYPLSILKFFGNFYRALGLNLVIHIFLAGIFMFFTARQFRLSKTAATLSGVAYAFAGYLVSLVAPGHDGKIFVTTLFPLTMLFLDRAFERRPFLNFTLLGLVIGVIILSPHPQLSYYSLWAIALYGLFRLINLFMQTKSVVKVVAPASLLVYAVIIGLLISAIQFYPGYVYTTEFSPRADTKRGYEWATSWSMNAEEAFSQIVPEFSGTNEGEGNYYWGKNAFKDNSEYLGIISIFLAFIGLFFGSRKEAIFFGGLAAFTFIYALGGSTPLFKLFYYLIPKVKSLRAPSTIMFVTLFSVSLLAGMGLQFIIDKSRGLTADKLKKLKIYLIGIPSLLLLLALLFSVAGESMLSLYSSIFYSGIESELIGQGNYTKWNLALLNLPNVVAGFWVVFLLLALVSASIMLYIKRSFGAIILFLIPLLVMIDGIRFNSRFISTYDHTREFAPNVLTDYIGTLPGKFRVANFRAVPHNMLPFHGIEVVTGYHGNQLRWYDDLLGGPSLKNFQNPHFLNLVGAKYLLAPSNSRIPPDYFGPDSLKVDRDFGQISLFRNDNALPRAFLVSNYEVIPDRQDIYRLILAGGENLREKVFLEKEPSIEIRPSDSSKMTAAIDLYTTDSVIISVNNDSNALLVLIDNYYRFWDAWIDGVKTEILRADGSFRAVPIKPGTHRVLFKYNRDGNRPAEMATMLTLLLVAIILAVYLWLFIKSKRKEVASI